MIFRTYQTLDGNQAAAHVAYAFSEAAAIYPITPSSPMAELIDSWAGKGRRNIYGHSLIVSQMQSEAGAAGAVHGALAAGALATTFTSSQGLLLMLPNIYRMAGELLPGVIHVAARTIATHALSIFGDHSDLYACRQTGAAIWAEASVQEVMDLTPVAHLAALEGRLPFLNVFDGFRTSHELHKIAVWDYTQLARLSNGDALERFRTECLHPSHGKVMGSAQNPDIFFQAREACNPWYDALPGIVEAKLAQINSLLGTSYGLFDYYGAKDAEHVIVAMGSVCETIREYLTAHSEKKYGLINVHLYRPFSAAHLLQLIPESIRQITVLSRTKEPGAAGEPLYLDVLAALQGTPFQDIPLYSGRYGLSSKDTTPSQIAAVYANHTKRTFTVGILDDVTHLSLKVIPTTDTASPSTISCKFWGLGGDGTISAAKNTIKIIGDHTEQTVQGYFEYDSKKSRGLTKAHLRFGREPIHSAYLISHADFAACHNPVYLHKYPIVQEVKDGGSVLLNCYYKARELDCYLPQEVKRYIAIHGIHLYLIDAIRIGKEIGLNNKISTILQAAFFATSGILPREEARCLMKEAARKSYGKQGEQILRMNEEAIDRGLDEVIAVDIPAQWSSLKDTTGDPIPEETLSSIVPHGQSLLDYVSHIQKPVNDQQGDLLPVSAFLPYADGSLPAGSSAHERRNVATEIPEWKPENCIQCALCSYVCPHAVIRPFALTEEEQKKAPEGMATLPMNGMTAYHFAISISPVDCTGCGSCAAVCPGKQGKKALTMCPIHEKEEHQEYFDYCKALPEKPDVIDRFGLATVKGSQFRIPLMEFSGACAGCGETAYVKLLTQIFGDRLYIANATGCSSIWANSSPTTAYTVNAQGHGPAWSNSLFEDGAEFGYGMLMAQEVHRLSGQINTTDTLQWVIGGDGWAYDIGFGGVDQVLASGKNINLLILDTEVYSNTGGQASKATPLGSTAKFVSGGKHTAKKDLAAMAMTYGNVYVAQIAMGADYAQTVKALWEAAAYPGPSLIIAYCTCIAHGIRTGLGSTPQEAKKAIEAGYYHLFRFNPSLLTQGKNPFQLDSREPKLSYEEFLKGEIRYTALQQKNPEEAEKLFTEAARRSKEKYQKLKKLEKFYEPEAAP